MTLRAACPHARWAITILVALCLLSACGRKGPPLPPRPVVPVAVGNFRAEPREGGILVSWARPTRNDDGSPLTDLLEFRLFRATLSPVATGVAPTAFSFLAAVRAEQPENATVQGSLYAYLDDASGHGLATGRQYRYRVQAANRRGQVGAFSPDVSVDFAAASLAPIGLKATAGDGTAELEWQAPALPPPAGLQPPKGYNVYRGVRSGAYDPQPTNATPLLETKFRDAGLQNDVTYYYVVRSVSNDRPPWRESADSNEASVLPQDRLAPAPPRGLVAISDGGVVALTWDPNPEADVLGYIVYRRELPHLTPVRLTDSPIPGTTFTDRTPRPTATYVYTVTAVDRSAHRNESAPSAEVEARLP